MRHRWMVSSVKIKSLLRLANAFFLSSNGAAHYGPYVLMVIIPVIAAKILLF